MSALVGPSPQPASPAEPPPNAADQNRRRPLAPGDAPGDTAGIKTGWGSGSGRVAALQLCQLVSVRLAHVNSPADIATVRRLVNDAFAEYRGGPVNFTGIDQDDALTARRMADATVYVAMIAGQAAGTISLSVKPIEADTRAPSGNPPPGASLSDSEFSIAGPSGASLPSHGLVGHISQFAISPQSKGQGLGSYLLDYAEGQARRAGACGVQLLTAAEIDHLLRFYTVRGYAPVRRLRQPGKFYDSLVLRKVFDPPLPPA